MFLFKKITALFFSPLSVILLLFIAGLFLLWFTSRQKIGKTLISLGVAIFVFCSYITTSDLMLNSLENKYPPIGNGIVASGLNPKLVVVLGGGLKSAPSLPLTSQISCESLTRLIEGIRIYRTIPGCKLLLSGGSVFGSPPEAEVMGRVSRSLGVNEQDIIIEAESRDTEDQAVRLQSMLGNEHFILVTSASHMPRTMALFKRLNMKPVPAPAMHLVEEEYDWTPGLFFPSSGSLLKSELAFYEYLGIYWLKLRGQI